MTAAPPLRYSELTPAMINALRVFSAIEQAYPEGQQRATKTLEGWRTWKLKKFRDPTPTHPLPTGGVR
jgi:hypothetical protein